MKNLKQLTQQIQELKTKSNDGELSIFDIMNCLQIDETWKRDSFYQGTDINKEEWKNAKFSFILRHIAGWSMRKFLSIAAVIQIENGRELFLKYGYENSIALKNMTIEERPKIILAVERHVNKYSITPNFYSIINKVFPNKKQIEDIDNGEKEKIKNLISENKKLKNTIKILENQLKKLNKENQKLKEMVTNINLLIKAA